MVDFRDEWIRTSFQVPEFDTQAHSDKLAATADELDDCQKECCENELSTWTKVTQFPGRRRFGNPTNFQVPEFDTQPHLDKLAATAAEQDDCQEEC